MPKTRPPYSPEFRRQMVDLIRAGRDPDELAREFEPTAPSTGTGLQRLTDTDGRLFAEHVYGADIKTDTAPKACCAH